MPGLVPFNSRRRDLANAGFGDFYNMLDDFFAEEWPFRRSLAGDTFKVDLKEDESNYYIEAELPGVKKEEIGVAVDDGRLSICVTREQSVEEEDKNYIHRERRCTSMQRNIFLNDADAADITAKLKDGVLSITVPKAAKQSKAVDVQIEE